MRGLRTLGYEVTICFDTLACVQLDAVLHLLDAKVSHVWDDLDLCPRTCPSRKATLCTYHRWFARPVGLCRPGVVVQQPLSARCMHVFLKFRMGYHSVPNVCGRWPGFLGPSACACLQCDQHLLGDERHLAFECPALFGGNRKLLLLEIILECELLHSPPRIYYYYYYYYYYTLFLPRGKVRPADKLQLKAAILIPLVGLARSKQDPINRGHGARYPI